MTDSSAAQAAVARNGGRVMTDCDGCELYGGLADDDAALLPPGVRRIAIRTMHDQIVAMALVRGAIRATVADATAARDGGGAASGI